MRGARAKVRTPRPKALLGAFLLALLLAALCAAAVPAAGLATGRAVAKPGRPAAMSPSGATQSTRPLFTWGKAPRAARYEVRVFREGDLLVRKTGISGLSWRCGIALPKNIALTWKVRARNTGGAGPWSASRTFTVALAVGDAYGGGTVAYILKRGDPGYVAGQAHGLIAAPADLTPADPWGVAWSNFTDSLIGSTAQGTALGTGRANTVAIVAQTIDNQHCTGGAAYLCDNLVAGGYDDWYLPSRDELDKLYKLYVRLSNTGKNGNFNPSGFYQAYWSSSECAGEFGLVLAWYQNFDNNPAPGTDLQNTHYKTQTFSVRAVRSF